MAFTRGACPRRFSGLPIFLLRYVIFIHYIVLTCRPAARLESSGLLHLPRLIVAVMRRDKIKRRNDGQQ